MIVLSFFVLFVLCLLMFVLIRQGEDTEMRIRKERKMRREDDNMAWVPDVMRNQELEKVLEVSNTIEIN